MSLLVICEILEVTVDTMTAEDKYYLRNSESFQQQIQVQLCKKQK